MTWQHRDILRCSHFPYRHLLRKTADTPVTLPVVSLGMPRDVTAMRGELVTGGNEGNWALRAATLFGNNPTS